MSSADNSHANLITDEYSTNKSGDSLIDFPSNSLAEPNVVSEPNCLLAYSLISTIVVLNLDTLSSNDIAPSFCKKYGCLY